MMVAAGDIIHTNAGGLFCARILVKSITEDGVITDSEVLDIGFNCPEEP